jgi:adenylate cyclase
MIESWRILISSEGELVREIECDGPLELGRQTNPALEGLYDHAPTRDGATRIVIALSEETRIARRHARVEASKSGNIRVTNLSDKVPLGFERDPDLKIGGVREVKPPLALKMGTKVVRIQPSVDAAFETSFKGLDAPVLPPMSGRTIPAFFSTLGLDVASQLEGELILNWIQTAMEVLQSAASDSEFFEKAAQAVVEVAELEVGLVLLLRKGEWIVASKHATADVPADRVPRPSRFALRKACVERKTFWLDPSELPEQHDSLQGVRSIVVAPILAADGSVIAALYGEQIVLSVKRRMTRAKAMLVEMLARSVAAGLARIEQEKATLALRTQFEQFFTPELAHQLTARPELLTGQDQEITVLFCDIRGFSRITGHLGPARTLAWVGDVLSTLSDHVLEHRGVLVDYIGDALMAMWGAPEDQPDHASRACRAAIGMLGCLDELNARWSGTLGEPMGLTIGMNTGIARVGNTGSSRKFKYGPLGDTVNVASRVQGASKYFKTNLLVTAATRDQIGPEFPVRRLGKVRLVNIAEPIDLYELFEADHPDARSLAIEYENSLQEFEAGRFRLAARRLGRIVNDYDDDGPSFTLLARALSAMVEEPSSFDSAFRLPGK